MVEQSRTNIITSQVENPSNSKVINTPSETSYQPKTALGKRLWEIRSRIVASGQPLLGWEEIKREVTERRGKTE